MNILITTVFDYPHTGGLSTHIQTLKDGLEQRGHHVDVFSFNLLSSVQRKFLVQGPSFLLNRVKKGKGFVVSHNMRKKLLQSYIQQHANIQYDIINAQDVYATLASVETGIPTVSTVHGYMSFEAISKGSIVQDSKEDFYIRQKEVKAYQATRKNITVDTRIKNYLQEVAQVDAVSIKNFINVDSFVPEKNKMDELKKQYNIPTDRRILFVPRRLTKKNGVVYPTLAMEQVIKEFPNALLLYAGTGEEMGPLKEKVQSLGLSDHVRLLGAVPHHEMKNYYDMSDIVLVPSVHDAGVEEATSISALEAMGSGSPLIATAIGGLKEIVSHDEDGFLVEEKNVESLASHIVTLLTNPEKGQQLAQKARQKIIDEYSHKAASEKYEAIYLEALQKN